MCNLQDLTARYDVALELLGERNELIDKLEEDIADMKSIFHSQLSLMADQLAAAQRMLSSPAEQPSR